MNIIATMFEEFLDILGYVSKQKAKYAAEQKYQKAYNVAYKDGYSAGYNDALNELPHKFNYEFESHPKPKVEKPDTLVLFIKADRGSTIIDVIRSNMSLAGISSDKLVSDVFRVWAGTEKQYNSIGLESLFSCDAEYSNIGREYDSVAIVLPYPKNTTVITQKYDTFSIAEVIRETVAQGLSCKKISNRLSFQKIEDFPLIEL